MKHFLTSFIALLSAYVVHSQSPAVLQAQSAYLVKNGKFILVDTLRHYHSNARVSYGLPTYSEVYPKNGVYNDDSTIKLDSRYGYTTPGHRYIRTFNSAGQTVKVFEESLWWVNSTYYESNTTLFTYNSAGLPDTVKVSLAGINKERTSLTYNNGQLVAQVSQTWNKSTNVWDTWAIDSFISNGADSTYVKYISGINFPLKDYNRHKMQLDANHRVLVDSYFIDKIFQTVTYSQYDAAGRKLVDSLMGWDISLMQMVRRFNAHYHYDINGNLVSTYYKRWDGNNYTLYTVDSMAYYDNNHLFSVQHYANINGALVPEPDRLFEYFYYGFPAGIDDAAKDKEFDIYPNPTTNVVKVSFATKPEQPVMLTLADITGKVYSTQKVQQDTELNMQHLAPGTYLLRIDDGQVVYSRNIVKQ